MVNRKPLFLAAVLISNYLAHSETPLCSNWLITLLQTRYFLSFSRGGTSICICLRDKCVLVCDSFVLSDSLEAALHVVNKRHPTLLYSLTISCDRGGTHARAQMSRGVLSGRLGSTCLSLAGWPPAIRALSFLLSKL